MQIWTLNSDAQYQQAIDHLDCLESAIDTANSGERITKCPISYLTKCTIGDQNYYFKVYKEAGKKLRKWFGKSRIKSEWENLLFFKSIGIPIPDIVAFGQTKKRGVFQHGLLVTAAIKKSINLSNLPINRLSIFKDKQLLDQLLRKVAAYTRTLHQHRFVHNDLKWRNILVQIEEDQAGINVFFIDSPLGKKKRGPFLTRGIIKDLACLDKTARNVLSDKERLTFYLYYQNRNKLTTKDKQMIIKISNFFKGRE